jgi:hypothetical protein
MLIKKILETLKTHKKHFKENIIWDDPIKEGLNLKVKLFL